MKDLTAKEFQQIRKLEKEKILYGCNGDNGNGIFEIKIDGKTYMIIASNGGGWEHVSVSNEKHIPSWNVMCKIKDLFFKDTETVIQFHPPKSEYVNLHKNCLHLWRNIENETKTPPKQFVG